MGGAKRMGRKMSLWRTLVEKVHKPMCSFGRHKVGTKSAHQLVSRFIVDKSKRIADSSALPMKLESQILSLNQKDVDHASCLVRGHLCQDIFTERSMRHAAVSISSKFARR
jgi:hypothetical protein